MKPPNHGLLHRVTITDENDIDFEGYLTLVHPGEPFTGLALVMTDGSVLLIDATDRIEVVR